mmetsp:Transcript_28304/g.54180  ORF Transcript_28304/g.54180 Transcript_28304/m.54180 type:complete len:455 (+) Transcript_28304:149-1513(+)
MKENQLDERTRCRQSKISTSRSSLYYVSICVSFIAGAFSTFLTNNFVAFSSSVGAFTSSAFVKQNSGNPATWKYSEAFDNEYSHHNNLTRQTNNEIEENISRAKQSDGHYIHSNYTSDIIDDQLVMKSFTYSNCPFTMAKFSQFEMSKRGPFSSESDRRLNSMARAEMALDLSNKAEAYKRVVVALKNGAFNRTITLEGDSLTRQLFISLSCFAWSAGYVVDYDSDHTGVLAGGAVSILQNVNYTASSKFIGNAHVELQGGGEFYYISHPSEDKIEEYSSRLINESCEAKPAIFNARYSWRNQFLPMKQEDLVIFAGGHHNKQRPILMQTYQKFFTCMRVKDTKFSKSFEKWPHFLYQMSSSMNFWTVNGVISSPRAPGKDFMSCQPSVPQAPSRVNEIGTLAGLVQFIGADVDVETLGEYHVGHGDCLHWIQPGVPDLFAADVADFVMGLSLS